MFIPILDSKYELNEEGKIRVPYSTYNNRKYNCIDGYYYLVPQLYKNSGYLYYSLKINNKVKNFTIHRLLAKYFIPNPNNYPCVNHIDGNKQNNSLDNLEWCTYKHNSQEAVKLGLIKSGKDC